MKTVTVEIKKNYAMKLLEDLERSDALRFVKKKGRRKVSAVNGKEEFFLSNGLWKDRDVTLESIRKKAYPKR